MHWCNKCLVKTGRGSATASNSKSDDNNSEFNADENASTISNASTNMSYQQDLDSGLWIRNIFQLSNIPCHVLSFVWLFFKNKKLNQLFIFLRGSRCQAKNKRRNRWQNWRLWRSNQQMSWRPPGKRVTYLFFIKFESILNSFFFKASRKGKTVWNS